MKKPIIIPPYLKKGDRIGMVCPASCMDIAQTDTCRQTLESWGFKVVMGNTVGIRDISFSGSDEERLVDLQAMLDDNSIRAIVCARGGYGTGRIIDDIDWRKFRKNPKWIVGFSDITVLHSFLYTRLNTASLHGPMANAFNNGGYDSVWTQSLKKALTGKKINYKIPGSPLNRKGTAQGPLVGGNLALIAHQVGTPSDLNTKGAILFLEDVGEVLYNIDRMMIQLDRAGKFKELAGLIIGGFTDSRDTEKPFGQTLENIISSRIEKYAFPVCYGFPVSHDEPNLALKTGLNYTLKVGKSVVLKEH